jgi:hypothetical protein
VLAYQQLRHHPRALRAFTGLDQAEFEKLLPHFEMAYHTYRYDHYVTKKTRQRRYGSGRKPRLASMEDKLLFILMYFKVYPLQEVMAFLLGVTPILTLESLSAFAEGNDFLRQHHRPFVRFT